MKNKIIACILFSFISAAGSSVFAQQNLPKDLLADSIYPYNQNDADMMVPKSGNSFSTKGILYGGWLNPVIIDDNDGVKNLRTSMNSLKIWIKSYLWENSFLYIRGKDTYTKLLKMDGYDKQVFEDQGYKNDAKNVIDLDVGFITMTTETNTMKLTLGRNYFLLGSGLVLNGRGDGAELNIYSRYVKADLFGAYTGYLKKDDDPYKLSTRDNTDGSNRVFAGGSLSFDIDNQSLYFMGMSQKDRGKEAAGEKSLYQSQYYGGGLKGVIMKMLQYNAEFVYETGKSYTQAGKSDSIKAYAAQVNINYYFVAAMNPVLSLQYAYGSGDKDKSSYSSPNGNVKGDDTGFLAFGTYVGGYALRPVLANMHVARGGFTLSPFSGSDSPSMKRINLIGKYSYYLKDQANSPIKSGEATEHDKHIGQGIDGSLRWGIFDDLAVFVNYSVFMPGKAYASTENDKTRKFFMGGLNLNF